jgi:DNA-binding SARP family transcriptional activator/class 3 adenylate cyclase/alpha-beta hydrolase superfamily lysophospholipase
MEFRLLGPLEVSDEGRTAQLGGRKVRALLALFLLHANETISVDRLVDDLWGEAAPDTARKMIQVYVSQLRKIVPEPMLVTRPPGYLLEIDPESLDLTRFERLLGEGRAALGKGQAEEASTTLRQALALWRGPALTEFPGEPFAQLEAARLEELRLAAVEERVEADLALGRHVDLVGELDALCTRHPLRERSLAQLMRALYGAGRQAEALARYRAFRERLADELGIEPSAALKDLERRMLRQEPELDAAPAPLRPPASSTAIAGQPPVRYARSDDVRIAYQVLGAGPLDLVLVHGWICTFQPGWENPRIASFYRRLASMGRLILFDKRGTGLSDSVPPDRLPDLETRMDDVRAVLDAVGSEHAVVVGVSEGGPMSALFAATYPQRTAGLVMIGTFARMTRSPDYPIGSTDEYWRARLAALEQEDWVEATTREWLGRVAPDIVDDEEQFAWYASYVMRGASPAGARALRLMNRDIDVRHTLPSVVVPTLVLFRRDEWFAEASRYLGEHIIGAKVVELPGNDHLPWEGDQDVLLDEIERYLAGIGEQVEPDRKLATILFADIVGSTQKAVELGDRDWTELLHRYRLLISAQVGRFRGHEIDAAGDGVLATFDGPARAIRCACSIVRSVDALGLSVRVGLHTGEVELANGDVRGIAVHIGARVAAEARPGEVLVSRTVSDLVAGSGLEFEYRGRHELKGVPGEWELMAVPAQE